MIVAVCWDQKRSVHLCNLVLGVQSLSVRFSCFNKKKKTKHNDKEVETVFLFSEILIYYIWCSVISQNLQKKKEKKKIPIQLIFAYSNWMPWLYVYPFLCYVFFFSFFLSFFYVGISVCNLIFFLFLYFSCKNQQFRSFQFDKNRR